MRTFWSKAPIVRAAVHSHRRARGAGSTAAALGTRCATRRRHCRNRTHQARYNATRGLSLSEPMTAATHRAAKLSHRGPLLVSPACCSFTAKQWYGASFEWSRCLWRRCAIFRSSGDCMPQYIPTIESRTTSVYSECDTGVAPPLSSSAPCFFAARSARDAVERADDAVRILASR